MKVVEKINILHQCLKDGKILMLEQGIEQERTKGKLQQEIEGGGGGDEGSEKEGDVLLP